MVAMMKSNSATACPPFIASRAPGPGSKPHRRRQAGFIGELPAPVGGADVHCDHRRSAAISSFTFARSTSMSASVGGLLAKGVSSVVTAFVFAEVPAIAEASAALLTSPGH